MIEVKNQEEKKLEKKNVEIKLKYGTKNMFV